ncbi:MAG: hypothetical protein HQL08_11025 [Nitrospirae bacterium]|nr:hypothetical protein [Nitrospirota bacterium]
MFIASGGTASPVIAAILAGSAAGATSAALNGGSFRDILQGAIIGGMLGGAGGGIYGAFGGTGAYAMLGAGAAYSGATGGLNGLAYFAGGMAGGYIGASGASYAESNWFGDEGINYQLYASSDDKVQSSINCVGHARILQGNADLIGEEGAFPGVEVREGSAAIIPEQFGVSKNVLSGYVDDISGSLGKNTLFNGITDVIGGKSPIPGLNVRTALQQMFPNTFIVEIPGLSVDMGTKNIILNIPSNFKCPTGTAYKP